jgi:hypothetical protein
MLAFAKLEPDFSRGCACKRIGHILFATHPLSLAFAHGSMSAQRVRWFSPQRIFIHCPNTFCLARSRRVENRPLAARIRVGPCSMLYIDFGDFLFHALR